MKGILFLFMFSSFAAAATEISVDTIVEHDELLTDNVIRITNDAFLTVFGTVLATDRIELDNGNIFVCGGSIVTPKFNTPPFGGSGTIAIDRGIVRYSLIVPIGGHISIANNKGLMVGTNWVAGNINRDSIVNLEDFAIMAENWLEY